MQLLSHNLLYSMSVRKKDACLKASLHLVYVFVHEEFVETSSNIITETLAVRPFVLSQ